jgi:hypothetical protein
MLHPRGCIVPKHASALWRWLVALAAGALAVSPAAAQVTVTRGPYLQSVSSTAATFCWRTSAATASRVVLGASPGDLTISVTDPVVTTNHEVRVTALLAAQAYAYRVGTATELLTPASSAYVFKTAPVTGASVPVRVWIVGDSGESGRDAIAVRDRAEAWFGAHPPDLWLMLGDNAYSSGTDSEYQAGCFDQYPSQLCRWPLFPTRGNHDVISSGAWNDYADFFVLPSTGECGGVPSGSELYYSYDWGPVHFIVLDSEDSDRSLGGPMIQWMRQDLAATGAAWIVCYWHHPPYTHGSHNSDDTGSNMWDMRTNVVPILDSTGVDLVLAGHSHGYERSYLLNGHYGTSNTLTSAMKVGPGDGRPNGNGPYTKAHANKYPFEGAVYTVAGSSSQVSRVSSMPCMVASMKALGSVVLDIAGNRLDARFIDNTGAVRDSFAIVKGANVSVGPPPGSRLRLAVPRPNPARSEVTFEFELPQPGSVTLDIVDAAGRRVARLVGETRPAGPQRVEWRGTGALGRPAPAGLYWAVLKVGSEMRVRRVVLTP